MTGNQAILSMALLTTALACASAHAQQRIFGSAAAEGLAIRQTPLPSTPPIAAPALPLSVRNGDERLAPQAEEPSPYNADPAESAPLHESIGAPILPVGYRQYAIRPWYTQPYRYYSYYRPWYTYGLYGPAYYRYHYAPSYYGYPGPYYAPSYYLRPGYPAYPAYNFDIPVAAGCYYW